MKISKHIYALAIAGACSASVYAQSTLTFDFLEVGSDVQVTVSGSVTASLWGGTSANETGTGSLVRANTWPIFIYHDPNRHYFMSTPGTTVLGPSNIGTGSIQSSLASTSTTGTSVGFQARVSSNVAYLYTPFGWSSPTQGSLANVITISSKTFSSLGLTAGNYTWTVSNGSITDTINFNIGAASPVPEASGSVAGIGLAMAGLYQLRRRKAAVEKLSVES